MKNKKVTYLLLVLVLLLWGKIGYTVIKAFSGDDDSLPAITNTKIQKEPYNDYTIKEDTSVLKLNYPDPFATVRKDTFVKTEPAKPVSLHSAIKPAVDWSIIKYRGYVRNPQSKKLIALLNINGKNVMMQVGEKNSNIKLLKNMLDSVKVNYNGSIRNIPMASGSI